MKDTSKIYCTNFIYFMMGFPSMIKVLKIDLMTETMPVSS